MGSVIWRFALTRGMRSPFSNWPAPTNDTRFSTYHAFVKKRKGDSARSHVPHFGGEACAAWARDRLASQSCGPDPCAGQFRGLTPLLSELMNHAYLLPPEPPEDRPGREFLTWHNSEVYLG